MTTLLILSVAFGLIVGQPALLRVFPQLQKPAKDPWVEFWQPETVATRWQEVPPKRENAIQRWWNTPSALDRYNSALKTYAQVTPRLFENSTQLLHKLRVELPAAPDPPPPPSEIYIDGTTGKRIVPEHLGDYDKQQQLRDMEMQIRQHDQVMELAWQQLEQAHNNRSVFFR